MFSERVVMLVVVLVMTGVVIGLLSLKKNHGKRAARCKELGGIPYYGECIDRRYRSISLTQPATAEER